MALENSIRDRLLKALQSQQLYNKLGLAAIRIVKRRTRKQVDVHGDFFKSYSEGYIKKKEAAGFTDPHVVNLTFSKVEGMLNSIDHEVANDFESVSIFFKNKEKEQIARYHNIEGAGKGKVIREFFGIEMEEEKNELATIGFREIQNIFRRL